MTETAILTEAIWAEARGEPYFGQVAVGCVIRNRVNDHRWPGSYEKVLLQKNQFSCFNNGQRYKADMSDPDWERCFYIAQGIFYGYIPDVTHGANHYVNAFAKPPEPEWVSKNIPSAVTLWPGPEVGQHVFLKL